MKKEKLIKELSKELSANNLAIFAGAGLSAPAGFVNWKGLLKELAEELLNHFVKVNGIDSGLIIC